MALRRLVGIVVGLAVIALSALVAGLLLVYMSEYGQRRFAAAAGILVAGALMGTAAYFALTRACKSDRRALAVLAVLLAFLLLPVLSMFVPGRITHARFGLTVYGVIPVPSLDVTVGDNGVLWFRDKSHDMSVEEITALLSPDTDAIVIGTGWHGAVHVDSAVRDIEGVKVHILRTPEAFARFNELKAQGRKVVLIAHSTC